MSAIFLFGQNERVNKLQGFLIQGGGRIRVPNAGYHAQLVPWGGWVPKKGLKILVVVLTAVAERGWGGPFWSQNYIFGTNCDPDWVILMVFSIK